MAKDPSTENIALFSDLEEQFRENGGYEAEATMARLADGLGLRQDLLLEDIESLSGGQRRRVDLIRILFQGPDTMILDEPTNHLDLPAKRWLMDELERFPGAILVVSHDLKLLDRSINKVLHLSDARLHEFKGTYSSYLVQLEADQSQRERSAAARGPRDRPAVHTGRLHAGQHQPAGPHRQVPRQAGGAARVGQDRGPQAGAEELASSCPTPRRSGEVPLRVDGLGVRYDANTVLDDVDFHCRRGDRVVVIGRNGAGKSSLLRCLAGVQAADGRHGRARGQRDARLLRPGARAGRPDVSVLDNIDDSILTKETERRALLGSFGLVGKAAYQMPKTLSGGERAKLGWPCWPPDRPTSSSSTSRPTTSTRPRSRRWAPCSASWPGTIVVVSHDRAFVEALEPTHCLKLPDEVFTHWGDDYLDMVEMK